MKSNKPYLLRAFFQWIVDNHCTPLITLNVNIGKVIVPVEYIENGEITLNISPDAVTDLKIANSHIEFSASFSGVVHFIIAPIGAVQALYAHENGEGMFFDAESETDNSWEIEEVTEAHTTTSGDAALPPGTTKPGAPHLRVIK